MRRCALCRFFLVHSGPNHTRYCRSWSIKHILADISLTAQERYDIDHVSGLAFAIDVVLRDMALSTTRCVLDSKYKPVSMPSTDDIAQVVAYAKAMHWPDAILAYPFPPTCPVDATFGDVRVRSVTFALDQDVEFTGAAFLHDLLLTHSNVSSAN